MSTLFSQIESFTRWTIAATDRHTVDIQNSVCSIIVGCIFFLNNGRLYERSPQAWQMFEVLPEFVWGVLYAGTGLAHLFFLRWNLLRPRKCVLLLKAGLWIFLGTALLAGVGWWAPAVWIYYVFAAVAFRGYFKIQTGAK
jgi:hypothetical protein